MSTRMFLVKQVTPGRVSDSSAPGRAIRTMLPFEIEVNSTPETRTKNYESICGCKQIYRITEDSVNWLELRGMFLTANRGRSNPCVCACMGEFI
jgi:hypothetical protein